MAAQSLQMDESGVYLLSFFIVFWNSDFDNELLHDSHFFKISIKYSCQVVDGWAFNKIRKVHYDLFNAQMYSQINFLAEHRFTSLPRMIKWRITIQKLLWNFGLHKTLPIPGINAGVRSRLRNFSWRNRVLVSKVLLVKKIKHDEMHIVLFFAQQLFDVIWRYW